MIDLRSTELSESSFTWYWNGQWYDTGGYYRASRTVTLVIRSQVLDTLYLTTLMLRTDEIEKNTRASRRYCCSVMALDTLQSRYICRTCTRKSLWSWAVLLLIFVMAEIPPNGAYTYGIYNCLLGKRVIFHSSRVMGGRQQQTWTKKMGGT